MALPSRAYVGILVFAVMATLLVGGYTALVLAGYEPAQNGAPVFFEPPAEGYSLGHRLMFGVATVSCVLLTFVVWRQLLERARGDAAVRASARDERPPRPSPQGRSRMRPPPPPGYE